MRNVTTSQGQCGAKRSLPEGDKVTSLLILSSIFYLLSSNLTSHAIEIEPMRLERSLEAGRSYSGSFKLKNSSAFRVEVSVSAGDYRYIFSEGTIPPENGKRLLPSCRDWFQFEKTRFSLNSGGSAEAKFIIKVPNEAQEEHLCAVLFDEKRSLEETKPKQKEASAQIQLTPRFSIPVYISIKGYEKFSAEIKEITVSPLPEKGGARFSLTLENTGNCHIRPSGQLTIFNNNGEVIKNIPVGGALPIFPGYKERIPVICPNLPAGRYSAVATVEISKDVITQKKAAFEFNPKYD